jgi:hypothetical protein
MTEGTAFVEIDIPHGPMNVTASRRDVFEQLRPLVKPECPFANLPDTHKSRWGDSLDAEKMKKCVWVQPELVAFKVRRIAR